MKLNCSKLNNKYNFDIVGVSYVGEPKPNTVMYASKKVEVLLAKLYDIRDCLVFIENGIMPDIQLKEKHCFIQVDNPQLAYTKFIGDFAKMSEMEESGKKYTLTTDGYFLGDSVLIGEGTYIEPGCLIGHDVVIGKNCRILSHAVIKRASIGNNVLCNEMANIGGNGFTMADDEAGNKIRIPTLGKVIIGDNVEIGAHDNISCGSAGNTIIENNVKINDHVHIGHDVYIEKNVEITACCSIGGFCHIGANAYMGMNSTLRNRREIGSNSIVGMGAVVIKDVVPNTTVVGNPVRVIHR